MAITGLERNKGVFIYMKLGESVKGLRAVTEKETPITHSYLWEGRLSYTSEQGYGKLVVFYCIKCGEQLTACYEADSVTGGGISDDWHSCNRCGNVIDFGKFCYRKVIGDGYLELED